MRLRRSLIVCMSRADSRFERHAHTYSARDKRSSLTYPPSDLSWIDQPVGHPTLIGGTVTS